MKCLFMSDIRPNLALMKLARYEVDGGNEVYTECQDPDRIYASYVFDGSVTTGYLSNGTEVVRGGRAVHPYAMLRTDIEHLKPYYPLYDLGFSMGFTSRGCIRKCQFCDNWKREGPIRNHAPLEEFLEDGHNRVVILDNNFLASPRWRENLQHIANHGLWANFHQGLDIRLVDEEKAGMLADARPGNYGGTKRDIHFAFDRLEDAEAVRRGVGRLVEEGIRPSYLYFYMIVGFWSKDITYDYVRLAVLKRLGVNPHPMVHENATDLQRKFTRWVLKARGYRSQLFSEYKRLSIAERREVELVEDRMAKVGRRKGPEEEP